MVQPRTRAGCALLSAAGRAPGLPGVRERRRPHPAPDGCDRQTNQHFRMVELVRRRHPRRAHFRAAVPVLPDPPKPPVAKPQGPHGDADGADPAVRRGRLLRHRELGATGPAAPPRNRCQAHPQAHLRPPAGPPGSTSVAAPLHRGQPRTQHQPLRKLHPVHAPRQPGHLRPQFQPAGKRCRACGLRGGHGRPAGNTGIPDFRKGRRRPAETQRTPQQLSRRHPHRPPRRQPACHRLRHPLRSGAARGRRPWPETGRQLRRPSHRCAGWSTTTPPRASRWPSSR